MKTAVHMLLLAMMLLASTVMGQEDDTITLVPFTNETYEIGGIAPEGWTQLQPGVYSSDGGATVLAQQSAPLGQDALLQALLPQLGLTEAPEAVDEVTTETLIWTLYQVDVEARGVALRLDLALAEVEGKTYLVLLQTTPQEYDALHESVFLPVLEAFAPLTAETVPYLEEEVTFENGDVTLAGTLTLPEGNGPYPAVVLISGSGAQDRDESLAPIASIKPFRLIADYLTRNGIAVLRYDDRGVGASTGDFVAATTEDFASDASAAVDFLREREDISAIGILGHSEGGSAAPLVAVENENVAFVIGMAAPAVSGFDVLVEQNRRILEAAGVDETLIEQRVELQTALLQALIDDDPQTTDDDVELRDVLYNLIRDQVNDFPEDQREELGDLDAYAEQLADQQLPMYLGDWWRTFVSYNPGEYWAELDVPVLALYGGLDVQVDATQNVAALETALEDNEDVTIVTLPTANHIFQDAETGAVAEYGTLEQTFVEDFLPTITDWVLERFRG